VSANESEHAQRSPRRTVKKQADDRQLPATEEGRAHASEASAPLPDDQRERVWELHLRGVSQRQISAQLDLHRDTVKRLVQEGYRQFGAERRARMKRGLDGAVARFRRVQQQAWVDHDADDERERAVLEKAEYGARYTSQRSAYLRLILDAEKEIARLEGLYADDAPDVLGVLFQVIRVESGRRPAGPASERVVETGDAQDD